MARRIGWVEQYVRCERHGCNSKTYCTSRAQYQRAKICSKCRAEDRKHKARGEQQDERT